MEIFKYFFLIIVLSFIISCSSSYENISKNNFKFENNLSKYLFEEYKSKAKFEAEEIEVLKKGNLVKAKGGVIIISSDGTEIQGDESLYNKSNLILKLRKI